MSVPVVGVITRKSGWRFIPEIPATRFSVSGSFRPKIGLLILVLVMVASTALILVSFLTTRLTQMTTECDVGDQQSLAASNRRMISQLHRVMSQHQQDNYVVCGVGVQVMLMTMMQGARGRTRAQMRQVVELDDKLNPGCVSSLAKTLYSESDNRTTLSHRFFVDKMVRLNKDFVNIFGTHTGLGLERVSFRRSDEAMSRIKSWVGQSEGGSNDKFVVDSRTKILMVGAVNFISSWNQGFRKSDTELRLFSVSADHNVKVNMMKQVGQFKVSNDYLGSTTVVEIPMKHLSMVIFLPTEINGLKKLEERLVLQDHLENIEDILNSAEFSQIELILPKFTLQNIIPLKKYLKGVGVTDLFNKDMSDLTKISDERNLVVSDVTQKVVLEVTEDGNEAAGSLSTIVQDRKKQSSVVCDHPFVFVIKENHHGGIIFLGRLSNPSKS